MTIFDACRTLNISQFDFDTLDRGLQAIMRPWQFPSHAAFAATISKAQGEARDLICISLR